MTYYLPGCRINTIDEAKQAIYAEGIWKQATLRISRDLLEGLLESNELLGGLLANDTHVFAYTPDILEPVGTETIPGPEGEPNERIEKYATPTWARNLRAADLEHGAGIPVYDDSAAEDDDFLF